jgi:heptosyltransferase-3
LSVGAILLIQLGDIGDVVLSFPCIRALRETFPAARLAVVVREKARELVEDCPWVSETIGLKQGAEGLWKRVRYHYQFFSRIRRIGFDVAVDLRTGTRGAIMTLLSGAPVRIGRFSYEGRAWRNRVFTHLAAPDLQPGQHVADYYLKILTEFGIPARSVIPRIFASPRGKTAALHLLNGCGIGEGEPFWVLQPFSLWRYKELDAGLYADLISAARRRFQLPVILAGSAGEHERAEEIRAACGKVDVFNFSGKTSLRTYTALLEASRFFVGIDSAGLHMAAAVGTPTIGIFGPSSIDAWAPQGEKHLVIHKNWDCVPCSRKGCQDSNFSRCMTSLTLKEIVDLAWPHIERFGRIEKAG